MIVFIKSILPFILIGFSISQVIWTIFQCFTYKDIELPCGSFKLKRLLKKNVPVIIRIVQHEFYSGGQVPDDVLKEIYRKYGAVSWEESPQKGRNFWGGFKLCWFSFWHGYNKEED